ncbi:MAG: hypothetical protein ACTHK4_06900 [Mycobacteriales bacterium]
MSSVLFPVGPLPPRVYWVRRLVVLALPLILILLIAVSCSGGGKKSPSAGGNPSGPTTSPTTSSSSNPNAGCAPGQLSAKLAVAGSAPNSTYTIGQSPAFTATITNVSASTCQLTTNPATETWKVKSGAALWWTTASTGGCTIANTPVTAPLAPGATQKVSISWNGYRLLPGCTRGEQAQPGTYVLRATLDGVTAQQAIFHFTKSTTP